MVCPYKSRNSCENGDKRERTESDRRIGDKRERTESLRERTSLRCINAYYKGT